MKEILIQLVTAFLGALGFALLFGLHRRHLVFASLGGMITWGIYLFVHSFLKSPFLANLIASVFAVSLAEALAHWRKCPATLFVVPSIIPLVPGSSLYYAMSYAVQNELDTARAYGHQTLIAALAIAAGISFVTACRELHAARR
ncbi:MAG: threonine/serine exporter family protein [Oscillospiraceae bacterium]|nr:threonine/serine exporter family protein [Oscillospiraceae bacterium]